jgi:hypothetical protein
MIVKLLGLGVLAGAILVVSWILLRPKETGLPAQANDVLRPAAFRYTGAGSCSSSNCHGGVSPRSDKRVKQNEYSIWVVQDKHAKAYEVLFNEKSKRMARNLRLDKPETSNKCLDCHATNVSPDLRSRSFDIADGVSCESCHGPAEQWLGPHTTRQWTHQQSLEAGMYDTKDAVQRGEKCLTCHLGSSDKSVDHEMIAAGHPDLRFELDTYTAVMPPHWQESEDKGQWFGPRAWAVGQAVALREAMRQLARRSETSSWGQAWPEFAEFDCYACHHRLREPNWRQARDYKGTPGFPPLNDSHYLVFRPLVSHVSPQARQTLDQKFDELHQRLGQINSRRREIGALATEIASVAEQLTQQLAGVPFDQPTTRALLREISGEAQAFSLSGVRSAEQAAMALETLYADYSNVVPESNHEQIKAAISRLFDDLEDPARFVPAQFAAHMQAVHRFFQ